MRKNENTTSKTRCLGDARESKRIAWHHVCWCAHVQSKKKKNLEFCSLTSMKIKEKLVLHLEYVTV